MSKNYDIFISYRRKETADKAEHLFSLLEMAGYKGQVSFDRENFDGRFDLEILQRLDDCKDFIVVLAPGTLAELKEEDTQWYEKLARCSVSEFSGIESEMKANGASLDFVRLEIARAIAKGKHIIPVVPKTTESFNFSKLNLPDDIVEIKLYEATFYSDNHDARFKDVVPKMLPRLHTKLANNNLWRIIIGKLFNRYHHSELIDDYHPQKVEFDIFISYRRVDGREHARNIQLALKGHGYKRIFFDYDSIQKGEFTNRIIDAIYSCTDFILVLSPKSMKRCVKKGDPVANEIRTAVKYNKNIIPVTIDGKEVKWPRSFPEELKFIKGLQFHDHKSDSYFEHSIDELCEKLTCKKAE